MARPRAAGFRGPPDVPCDVYDVKLVDEDGDECIVAGVEVCSGNHEWVVSSEDLAVCEGYGD